MIIMHIFLLNVWYVKVSQGNKFLISFGMVLGQVEIKRTIPKGSAQSKDFKTKKIFVGGIPSAVTEGIFLSALNLDFACYFYLSRHGLIYLLF